MPITLGPGVPARASCARMYCLSSSLIVSQSRRSSLATSLIVETRQRRPTKIANLLVQRGLSARNSSRSRLTLAARSAKDAPDLDLKIDARVAARQVAHPPHRAIVPAAMQGSAVGAARFFERRFSLTMRAFGSPKMPRTVPSGRKLGNA
jgi:hypothetical protein